MPKNDPDCPPANAISLPEALERLSGELVSEPYWVGDRPYGTDLIDKYRRPPSEPSIIQCEHAVRHALRTGTLRAWGRDGSITGPWAEIPTALWFRLGDIDWELGLVSDECSYDGELRPATMRFWNVRVARAVETDAPRPARRRGRAPGSGYQAADMLLIDEMRKLKAADPALNVRGAAMRVVRRAAGGGSDDSKARRLAKLYRQVEQNG